MTFFQDGRLGKKEGMVFLRGGTGMCTMRSSESTVDLLTVISGSVQ